MVRALVLVAPSLSDMSLLDTIAGMPTALFWARDDPVKAFSLSERYTAQMSDLVLHAVDEGGHRVLDTYLPTIRDAIARWVPMRDGDAVTVTGDETGS